MEVQRQQGFGVGLWEGADQLEDAPPGSVTVANDCFVDPQGVLRSRNGAPSIQSNSWGGSRLSWVFEGQFISGVRTLAASLGISGSPGTTDATHGIAVLDGASALQGIAPNGYYYMDYPTSWTMLGSLLFIGGQGAGLAGGDNADATKQGMVYAGSRKTATYAPTGMVFTLNSPVVTRAAGGFSANVDVGMILSVGTPAGDPCYVVKSVDSDTQITLDRPYLAGAAGTPTFSALTRIGSGSNGLNYRASALYGSCAGRLLSLEGNKLYVSDGPDAATGVSQAHRFPVKNIIEFPREAQGVAVQTIRNQVFVFTTAGVYRVTGFEYEIVDPAGNPQWTIELLSRELVALANAAIVTWHQALIVPCRDAIYIVDGVNPPQSISQGVDWQAVVNSGVQLGQAAVHQGYYIVPVEKGTVAGSGKQQFKTYVFRLAPVQGPKGIVFPNARFGFDAEGFCSAGATRLLVAGGTLWDGGKLFDPVASGSADGDGSSVGGSVRSRPFPIGEGAVVRRVRLRISRDGGIPSVAVYSGSGASVAANGDVVGSSRGDRWIAYDLVSPMSDPEPTVNVSLPGPRRMALLAIELQYRATGLPARF